MGKVIFGLLFCLVFTDLAYSDVYLVVDKSTREIISISSKDDAVVESGKEKIVLPGERRDIELQHDIQYYKYDNGRFVLNVKKMTDDEKKADDFNKKVSEIAAVENRALKIACEQLVAESKQFDIIKCSDFEGGQ